jgi:hypothetical protein
MGPRMVEPEFSFRGRMNSFVFGKGVMGIAGENCKISIPEVFSAPFPTRVRPARFSFLASCAKRTEICPPALDLG